MMFHCVVSQEKMFIFLFILMFRLRSFYGIKKPQKHHFERFLLLFIINHTHFLKSHLHIFYKSIFYMISIISSFYKVDLFILFVQCIFPPASRSFACFFKEATIEIRSVTISASATNRSDALIRGRQQSACMPDTQSSNKI